MQWIKSILGGGWLTLATLFARIISRYQQDKHDDRVAEGAVAKAKLEGEKVEDAKVNAAIDAGNDSKRVYMEHDPQDRASKRKT